MASELANGPEPTERARAVRERLRITTEYSEHTESFLQEETERTEEEPFRPKAKAMTGSANTASFQVGISICREDTANYLSLMSTLAQRKSVPRPPAPVRSATRGKKPLKFELTAEDVALDRAISAAAARSLAKRPA